MSKIRLTESQLHQVIKESVNKILTELDWKTGLNGAKLAKKRGNIKLSNKLLNYATETLSSKYPHRLKHEDHYTDIPDGLCDYSQSDWFDPYLNTDYGYMNAKSRADGGAIRDGWRSDGEYHKSFGNKGVKGYGFDKDISGERFKAGEPNIIHTDPDQPDRDEWRTITYRTSKYGGDNWKNQDKTPQWDWKNMSDDMEKYYTGKSKYQKGKGWQ